MNARELVTMLGPTVGVYLAHLSLYPLLRRWLAHIVRRLSALERHAGITPTPQPPWGLFLRNEEITK